jgi:formylglycine-generating enzyme required for sulfatase activity
VNVSWYEAVAFCGWLGERLGIGIRLPTESEWEKSSRGPDGRIYPWGDEFDASRCNASETEIGGTSAVGCFPSGASPYGALDMSGNVWEWCSTKWRESYEEPADENLRENASRVLRGGSFDINLRRVRCAFRVGRDPPLAFRYLGFRVAAPI